MEIAAEFLQAKRFDYATIVIQTAAEIDVEQRLLAILAWRNLGPLGDLITEQLVRAPYNFRPTGFARCGRASLSMRFSAKTGARTT